MAHVCRNDANSVVSSMLLNAEVATSCAMIKRRYPSSPAVITSSSSDSSTLQPLFNRDNTTADRLSHEQRWTIIALHKEGKRRAAIASMIPCNINTVDHWIYHYEQQWLSGRQASIWSKAKDDESTDANIIASAIEKKFTTPKRIKREQQVAVSTRTIRRRLNEAGLFGHVATEGVSIHK